MSALTHFPKTRLSELIGRLGGISREDAIEEAKIELRSMRGKSDEVILESVAALEEIILHPETGSAYSRKQMNEILQLADQIVTLAGTFGYTALDIATRSLCDVTDGLLRAKRNDIASIHVHIRAIRMVVPGRRAAAAGNCRTIALSNWRKSWRIMASRGFPMPPTRFPSRTPLPKAWTRPPIERDLGACHSGPQ